MNRRHFLTSLTVAGAAAAGGSPSLASAFTEAQQEPPSGRGGGSLKIDAVDLLELTGHYTREAGIDRQA